MLQTLYKQIGPYLLFKSLKKGGMARVYLAVDLEELATEPRKSTGDLSGIYAVKQLLPELAHKRLHREMFASEGKVGLRLEHPNIVRTYECSAGGDADGKPAYIAMEYIFGFDMATVLRRLRQRGDTLPLPLGLFVTRQVLAGLMYAHELLDEYGRPLAMVNRDVSPGNIMVGTDGAVKLIDFGIAQTTIDIRSQIGTIKGKFSYMSPEQVRGLAVDHRSDLFSLAAVFYQMLTGVHIFHDEGDFATMERVRRAEAPPPSAHVPEIDAELDDIVLRAMARDAGDRYPSARSFLRDLDSFVESKGLAAGQSEMASFVVSLLDPERGRMQSDIESARDQALAAHRRAMAPEPSSDAFTALPTPPGISIGDTLPTRPRAAGRWGRAKIALLVGAAAAALGLGGMVTWVLLR